MTENHILTIERNVQTTWHYTGDNTPLASWHDGIVEEFLGTFSSLEAIIVALPDLIEADRFYESSGYIRFISRVYVENKLEPTPWTTRVWNLRGQRIDGFTAPYIVQYTYRKTREPKWEQWGVRQMDTIAIARELIDGLVNDGPPYPNYSWRVLDGQGAEVYIEHPWKD